MTEAARTYAADVQALKIGREVQDYLGHGGWIDDPGQCPYFKRGEPGEDPQGICDRGCREEPSCHTDIPEEGWLSARIRDIVRATP